MRAFKAVAIVLAVALGACSHETAEEVESETVVPVTTVAATTGTIRAVVNVTGTITAAPGADQLVVAPQPARIAEITKAEGDLVTAGDLLVRFEIPNLTVDVATRRGEVARARARLDNARAAQTRAHDLFDRGVAARREVEEADRELADAQAGITETEATLAASQTAASLSTVHARFNGVVAKRMHNAGEFAEATASDPVMRVVDPRRLEVTASVPIADVARVVVGALAHMANPAGGSDLALKVISRPAAVDPGTAAVPLRLSFAALSPAPIGAPVQVSINAEEHRDVVLVPAQAVVREANETAVFIANGDKAERRAVRLGLSDEKLAEIAGGVKAGESVIVTGQAGLPDGAKIAASASESKP
jgi:cobalt-zinc-cadmium efflux system membrane fusion protein